MTGTTLEHVSRIVAGTAGLPTDVPLDRNMGIVLTGLSLDSAAVLELLLALEHDFGIELDAQALLQAKALQTIGTLAAFIDSVRSKG